LLDLGDGKIPSTCTAFRRSLFGSDDEGIGAGAEALFVLRRGDFLLLGVGEGSYSGGAGIDVLSNEDPDFLPLFGDFFDVVFGDFFTVVLGDFFAPDVGEFRGGAKGRFGNDPWFLFLAGGLPVDLVC
jgi:hypothetical protein